MHGPFGSLGTGGALAALAVFLVGSALGFGTVLRFVVRLLFGGMVLVAVDVLGRPWHLHLGVNPVSLLVVGLLGVPGLLLLGGLHMLVAS